MLKMKFYSGNRLYAYVNKGVFPIHKHSPRSIFKSSLFCKMAVECRAKTEFEQILSGLSRKFDIIHVKWGEEKLFEIKIRTQIPRNSDDFNALCDEWVDLFSGVTSTVWVKKISNTGPKIRFRKQYQCWTQGGKEVQKELLFDSRRCKGTLDMKVLTDNPLTRRKNKHIRMGLNVVVKINFNHLHKVDLSLPFAFFVHNCEPLPEPPKPNIQPNDRLPQLVAEMVQKGLNSSQKSSQQRTTNLQQLQAVQNQTQAQKMCFNSTPVLTDLLQKSVQSSQIMDAKMFQNEILQLPNIDQALQVNQIIPVQNMESIKLQVQPQLTQVMVTGPQLDMSEHLLMCQPTLMFDPTQTQVIPVTLPHHFVQVHSHNMHTQQGHFL